MVRVRVKIKTTRNSAEESNQLQKFSEECNRYADSPNRLGIFLAAEYRKVFNVEPPNAMLCLIKAKIYYKLTHLMLKSSGKVISEKFMQNYYASQELNSEKFADDMRFYVGCDIKKEKKYSNERGGELIMTKVKKKSKSTTAVATASKTSAKIAAERPGAVFVELFSSNSKAKLSDAQIAKEIAKRCPNAKAYSVTEVRGYRTGYNGGKLSGQESKPKVASVSYDKE